jgi:hypothetical protein
MNLVPAKYIEKVKHVFFKWKNFEGLQTRNISIFLCITQFYNIVNFGLNVQHLISNIDIREGWLL